MQSNEKTVVDLLVDALLGEHKGDVYRESVRSSENAARMKAYASIAIPDESDCECSRIM